MPADMDQLREDAEEMSRQIFEAIDVPFADTTELQRQVLAGVAFGMLTAIGHRHAVSAGQVRDLAVETLEGTVKYAPHQADAFADDLFRMASEPCYHRTMKAVIARGMEAYALWDAADMETFGQNVAEVLMAFNKRG